MQKKGLFLQRIKVKSHELEKIVEIMNDFQNYEKKCDGKNGLSVGKKAGFRRNLDLIFQYDGKK